MSDNPSFVNVCVPKEKSLKIVRAAKAIHDAKKNFNHNDYVKTKRTKFLCFISTEEYFDTKQANMAMPMGLFVSSFNERPELNRVGKNILALNEMLKLNFNISLNPGLAKTYNEIINAE